MTGPRVPRWFGLTLSALMLVAAAAPVAATQECAQVRQLMSQGFSINQIASEFGVPVGAIQSCAAAPALSGPAGPAPIGAAGPPPHGAAGPPPIGAAGPAPHGAAGPAPIGAASNKAMNR